MGQKHPPPSSTAGSSQQQQVRCPQGKVNRSLSGKGQKKNEFCNTKPHHQINNRPTRITRKTLTQKSDKGVVGESRQETDLVLYLDRGGSAMTVYDPRHLWNCPQKEEDLCAY